MQSGDDVEEHPRPWVLDDIREPSNPLWTTCLQTSCYMKISVMQWSGGLQNLEYSESELQLCHINTHVNMSRFISLCLTGKIKIISILPHRVAVKLVHVMLRSVPATPVAP